MNRQVVFCSFLMVAVLSAGRPARAGEPTGPPDLTGDWRLDPKHSDTPQRPGGGFGGGGGGGGRMGRRGGGGGGGGWGGRGGGRRAGGGEGGSGERGAGENGGDPSMSAAGRPVRLPDLMHVTQSPVVVSFADSSGTVLREVADVPAEADTLPHAPGAEHLSGQWKGSKLVIQRTGPRDSKITETISLENKGKSLQIDTKIESGGERPSREFKRVYNRVS
ncbi:MAG TPA: hypothetical protein VEU09_10120 [Candidatus Binatia bacterium]|nr:hypothetical protein [Candidatus Binatia bacterium]